MANRIRYQLRNQLAGSQRLKQTYERDEPDWDSEGPISLLAIDMLNPPPPFWDDDDAFFEGIDAFQPRTIQYSYQLPIGYVKASVAGTYQLVD